jgi:Carboxypeptidase regulatory-like domain
VNLRTRRSFHWPSICATAFFLALSLLPRARAETPDLKGEVTDENGASISGAVCTLSSSMLPAQGLSVTTGEKGQFHFPGLLPGTYSLVCAAVGFEPVSKSGLEIGQATPPFLQLALPKEVVVHEQVEVKEKVNAIATSGSTAPPSRLSSPQLTELPLVEQKFKAALPLVPGVIRTPNGRINIKGATENQGILLVDSAEMVDPVTGSYSINVPIDAVESLQVYKSAYQAQYGRFSGGLTKIETKAPSDQFRYEVNDFLPTVRVKSGHIVGIANDVPRLYVTGPLVQNKLNFSEALEYELDKQPVRGLAWPHNEIKSQGFSSFSSFQYVLSPRKLMTSHLDLFPLRRQFANINSLLPQTASSDYGQEGFSAGSTYRYMSETGAILTTLFEFTRFDSNAHGQGPLDMLVTPTFIGGNYFNSWRRNSDEAEVSQIYQWQPKKFHGTHELQAGASYERRTYSGTSISHPVLLLRTDGSVAERIDFSGPAQLDATDNETAVFLQDHWVASRGLALDAGIRFSTQNIGNPAAFAPRFGLVYSPGSSGKTIFRGGVGIFYSRVPLLAGDFTSNPQRTVSLFDAQGALLGTPITYQNAYIRVNDKGQQVVPSNDRLASTPYNLTWNLEGDRELYPHLVLRISYLYSRTFDEFTINPLNQAGQPPSLLLTNTGRSRYHEFETTLRYHASKKLDLNFSYVNSLARGDLNTLTALYVPFEQPVIRPNAFGTLPSNVPNRFVTWGRFQLPWKMTASPVLDIHSGFPYSAVDVLQEYACPPSAAASGGSACVPTPNGLRLPAFASLDLKMTKDFRFPIIPWLSSHQVRLSCTIFNVTDHNNPRDVINNVTSPRFGDLLGLQHRFYDVGFDIVY